MRRLPTFNGYTVDMRLKQFRMVHWDTQGNPTGIDFIPFSTKEGQQLLTEYLPIARQNHEIID